MSSNGEKSKKAAELAAAEAKELAEKQEKEKAAARKKKLKPIIISAVAVILVAAIIICGYFFWYKPKSLNGKATTFGGGSDKIEELDASPDFSLATTYKTVDYKGYALPENAAEIMTLADKDIEAACEKSGIAFEIAGEQVSFAELKKEYINQYFSLINNSEYTPALTADSAPAEQKYTDTMTWKDNLAKEAYNELTEQVLLFSEALKHSVKLSDDEVLAIDQNRNVTLKNAENLEVTPDEYIASVYGEGITLNIYLRDIIRKAYVSKYTAALFTGQYDSYADSRVEDIYNSARDDYDYVDVRIMDIGVTDEEWANKARAVVKNLDSFYSFAIEYYSKRFAVEYTKEEIEIQTLWLRSKKSNLKSKLSDKVAEWCFADSRKPGDITVIKADQYRFLCYMIKPQYTNHSLDLYQAEFYYDPNSMTKFPSDEQIKAAQGQAEAALGEFEATQKTADDFNKTMSSRLGGTDFLYKAVRCNDINRNVVEWAYSPDRKPGDYAMLETGTGFGLYMFSADNTDDLDYQYYIRAELTEQDYEKYLGSLYALNGNEVKIYDKIYNSAIDAGEKYCADYLADYKQYLEEQSTEQPAQ